MITQSTLAIDISNIDFNSTKFRMVGDLTLDKVKIKYNWIFNAHIKDAIIGEDQNGLVWYSGIWISGTWESGTWYSGTFLDGRWKSGNVYSYDIDIKQLLNGNFYIIRTDISKTNFVRCSFEGGNFNYGIFGNLTIKNNVSVPYEINRDFILNNIEDVIIDIGFNSSLNNGFYLEGGSYYIKSIISDDYYRTIVCGYFNRYNNVKTSGLLRLNYDGSIEDTFNGGFYVKEDNPDDIENNGFLINSVVNKVLLDSKNRIIVCGDFNYYNKTECYKIIRLLEDGSIDSSFNVLIGINDIIETINDIYIDSDNKIYLGGNFYIEFELLDTLYKYKNLVRLNEDGSIDTGFGYQLESTTINTYGFELNGVVSVLKNVKSNTLNRLLVGGDFTLIYEDITYSKLLRITMDGKLDTQYLNNCTDVNFNGGDIFTIDIDSKNRMYVGGDFNSYSYKYNGILYESSYSGVVRLEEDGTIDISSGEFTTNGGFSNSGEFYIRSIKVDSNDDIIVGGLFNNYNGDIYHNIIKINSDGSVDETFNVGYGTFNLDVSDGYNGSVNTIFVDDYGKIYLGGNFDIYNEVGCNLILRLNTDGILDNINNKFFLESEYNRSIFKGGNFYNGVFNSSIFKNGNFYNGYFNNSIWESGVWYNGEFLSGEWYNGVFLGGVFSNGNWYGGEFSQSSESITSQFGLNFRNKKGGSANWHGGTFSNGGFYSLYRKILNETEKLNYSSDTLEVNDNTIVNWFNGVFNNGVFYGGTIHNCEWVNGMMYDSIILNIDFNNGHIYDTICYGGVFKGGSISGGIYSNIISENTRFGYEIQ